MYRYLTLTFLIFISVKNAVAFENQMILRGGGILALNKIRAYSNTSTMYAAGGLKSDAGYRYTKWEFSISSQLFYGRSKDPMVFRSSSTTVTGKGKIRSVSFGPFVKYFTDILIKPSWHIYFGAGPSWSQQTVKFRDFTVDRGVFTTHNRISSRSFGFNFSIGIEEMLKYKEMHPVFFEINYSYHESNKISLLDATKTREIETLSIEDTKERIYCHSVVFSAGMIIF